MESLSSESLLNEQKITIQNSFVLEICKKYRETKKYFEGFRDLIMDEFKKFLFTKKIILPDSSKRTINEKIKRLHSRLVAPSNSIEFEVIIEWEIYNKKPGYKQINEEKKIYCQYFKDWFISGNINL